MASGTWAVSQTTTERSLGSIHRQRCAHLDQLVGPEKSQVILVKGRQRFRVESQGRKRSQKRTNNRIHLRKFQASSFDPISQDGEYGGEDPLPAWLSSAS